MKLLPSAKIQWNKEEKNIWTKESFSKVSLMIPIEEKENGQPHSQKLQASTLIEKSLWKK